MALHRLTTVTLGVPDVEATSAFYREVGLTEVSPGRLATADGGEQLRLQQTPQRSLIEIGFGVDDSGDLGRIRANLSGLEVETNGDNTTLHTVDPGTGARVVVSVADRITSPPSTAPATNGPGRVVRENARSDALETGGKPVQPRKLSHMVVASPDAETSERFFTDGIGLKVSDTIGSIGSFLRCSTDHHNLLLQPGPCTFLHHTAWEVETADEILRGGAHMLEHDPTCHMWGFGRHYIGSNYFWYLRDPAGNFVEYMSDLDVITEDAAWTPGDFAAGPEALAAWGPPPPLEFLMPADVPELMQAAAAASRDWRSHETCNVYP